MPADRTGQKVPRSRCARPAAPRPERHRVEDGAIAEITTFGTGLFPGFGPPPTLPTDG